MTGEDAIDHGSALGLPDGERRTVAVLDACVLFAAAPRDVLLELAGAGAFHPKWTEEIHSEWMRGLARARPDIPRAKLEALRCAIDAAAPDCLVRGHLPLVPKLSLPDRTDRHVLAAAVHCNADLIVTLNVRHFPSSILAAHRIGAVTPDRLVASMFERSPSVVCGAVRRMRARLRSPPCSALALLDLLARHGLPESARLLRPHASRL